MRLLGEEYDVTALCFYGAGIQARKGVEDRTRGLMEVATRVEAYPIPQSHSPLRFLLDHLRSVLGGRAYTRWVYESRDFRHRLRQLLHEESFDVVHVDSLDLVAYLPDVSGLPVVCAHHNVEICSFACSSWGRPWCPVPSGQNWSPSIRPGLRWALAAAALRKG